MITAAHFTHQQNRDCYVNSKQSKAPPATEAFRTSPIASILVETGIPSLANRQKAIIASHALKLLHKADHPLSQLINVNRPLAKYQT